MKKYPNTLLYAILFFFFMIPLAMKMLFKGKEIYPSVVMPAGVALIHVEDEDISFKMTQLYGKDKKTGELTPLNHKKFLYPAPVQYLGKIVGSEFGLSASDHSEQLRSITWVKTKLKEQHCQDSSLIVRRFIRFIPSMKEQLVNEKEFKLY